MGLCCFLAALPLSFLILGLRLLAGIQLSVFIDGPITSSDCSVIY